jgi:VacB/RNase II family 3'-5' exoribonuclease
LTENIGRAGELEVELEAILRTHGVDQSDFPPDILSSLPDPGIWRISEQEVAKRRDLRNTRIFTIDPPTARDMDDAISCILEPGSDEIAEVGVHIADVTYFLAKGSPLDELAKKKATTVYVVEYSIPMLPRALSDTLCSLTPHEDRLAVSIIWRMNVKTGKLVNENKKPWIGRSIIRSCVKMDYGTAQRMIEGDFDSTTEQLKLDPVHPEHTSELVKQDVLNLDRIAKVIRKGRFERGALGLNSVKLSFIFDRSEQTNQSGGKPRLSVPTSCFSYITKVGRRRRTRSNLPSPSKTLTSFLSPINRTVITLLKSLLSLLMRQLLKRQLRLTLKTLLCVITKIQEKILWENSLSSAIRLESRSITAALVCPSSLCP